MTHRDRPDLFGISVDLRKHGKSPDSRPRTPPASPTHSWRYFYCNPRAAESRLGMSRMGHQLALTCVLGANVQTYKYSQLPNLPPPAPLLTMKLAIFTTLLGVASAFVGVIAAPAVPVVGEEQKLINELTVLARLSTDLNTIADQLTINNVHPLGPVSNSFCSLNAALFHCNLYYFRE